jgi:hypothetical protein
MYKSHGVRQVVTLMALRSLAANSWRYTPKIDSYIPLYSNTILIVEHLTLYSNVLLTKITYYSIHVISTSSSFAKIVNMLMILLIMNEMDTAISHFKGNPTTFTSKRSLAEDDDGVFGENFMKWLQNDSVNQNFQTNTNVLSLVRFVLTKMSCCTIWIPFKKSYIWLPL